MRRCETIEISTIAELQAMSADLAADYVLVNDVDASATSGWNGGEGFAPIGGATAATYNMIFDGAGFAISNLFINRNAAGQSLLGQANSASVLHVRDLKLVDCDITGSDTVGSLISRMDSADITIERCGTEGGAVKTTAASGTGVGSGGLIGGAMNMGTCVDCYNHGTTVTAVNNGQRVGGLVGDLRGEVRRCYVAAQVIGTGSLTNTFNGRNSNSFFSDNFADTELSGRAAGSAATGKTTAEMKNIATFSAWSIAAGFDETKVWGIGEELNGGYAWLQSLQSLESPPGGGAVQAQGYLAHYDDVLNNVKLFRVDGGLLTQLAELQDVILSPGDVLALRAMGPKLAVAVNGEPMFEVEDSTYTRGKCGFGSPDAAVGDIISDFAIVQPTF